MAEETPKEQVIGTIALQALADGSGALATFNLLGVMTVQLKVPAPDVENFVRAWVGVKRTHLDLMRAMQQVKSSRND